MKSIPANTIESTPRIILPSRIQTLAETARERTFGLVQNERDRRLILHGYLLALEEVMRG